MRDVISVIPLADYRLRVRFDDGVEAEIDIRSTIPFRGVFAPLRDTEAFRQVSIHKELGVIYWPNGADLDSDVLYAQITGKPLPASATTPAAP